MNDAAINIDFNMSLNLTERLDESERVLRGFLPADWSPRVLLTLGSGLGDLADVVENPTYIPYTSLPHLRASTAPGHRNCYVTGRVDGVDVLCMQGRLHPYDGFTPAETTYPVRLAARLGIETFIVTNTTGAINDSYRPGQVVAIADHINFTGQNPLVGPNFHEEGPRFPDMTHAYTPRLRALARAVAHEIGYDLQEGVYIGLSGPSFETPAEIRAFRTLGADLVGMSTVWEVIVAAHCGMKVLGLSMAVNMAAGMTETSITVEEINEAEKVGAAAMERLVRGVLMRL